MPNNPTRGSARAGFFGREFRRVDPFLMKFGRVRARGVFLRQANGTHHIGGVRVPEPGMRPFLWSGEDRLQCPLDTAYAVLDDLDLLGLFRVSNARDRLQCISDVMVHVRDHLQLLLKIFGAAPLVAEHQQPGHEPDQQVVKVSSDAVDALFPKHPLHDCSQESERHGHEKA